LGNLSLLVFIKVLAQDKHSSGHGSPFKPRQLIFYDEQNNECCAKLSYVHERIQNSDVNESKKRCSKICTFIKCQKKLTASLAA